MVVAQKQWADMEVPEAKYAMESAEVMLEENSETLLIVIQMLHGLPSIEVTEQSKPELIQLVEVLALASEHQGILRRTSGADSTELSALGQIQQDLAERCSQWAGEDDGSEELTLAAEASPVVRDQHLGGGSPERVAGSENDDQVGSGVVQRRL